MDIKDLKTEDDTTKWLLNSEPWIEYGVRVELLGQSENDPGGHGCPRADGSHSLLLKRL